MFHKMRNIKIFDNFDEANLIEKHYVPISFYR